MNNFIGDNINAIRIHKGLSQDKLAEAAGVSQTTVSAWECGTSIPRKSNVMKLIEAIPGIDFDDVMSEENGFSSKIKKDAGKTTWVNVPLYGNIAAGNPIEMQAVDDTFVIPAQMRERYPDSFLLRIKGTSMDRVLPDGSYALVDPCNDADIDGDPYAVCVNGYDATIKRVRKLANGFELMPDSTDPTYKPVVYDYGVEGTEEITVIGRVVYYVLPFDWGF